MPDDKTKMDQRDRSRVAEGEDYEVRHFAERHGISMDKTRELIQKHGNDREKLDREASRLGVLSDGNGLLTEVTRTPDHPILKGSTMTLGYQGELGSDQTLAQKSGSAIAKEKLPGFEAGHRTTPIIPLSSRHFDKARRRRADAQRTAAK